MYLELSNAQSKQYLDAAAAHEGWTQTFQRMQEYRGGMHWKTIGGRQYLYRTHDRRGNAKSHGPRSPDTERIYGEFSRRKAELAERLEKLDESLRLHTRVNAAHRLGTVPAEVLDVCEVLSRAQIMGKGITVIGTNAMHAYGFLAGVRFDSEIMATTDVDLLWNHKAKLSLVAGNELSAAGLLGLLKQADKTYEQDPAQPFRARSASNFMVDLIRQTPVPPWAQEPDRFFDDDLVATDIPRVQWLLSAPKLSQLVVGVDGRMTSMTVPDPRAFAAYKLWLSQQVDREPMKKGRDLHQAKAVIRLIQERLPHLGNWGAFKSIPREIMGAAWDLKTPGTGHDPVAPDAQPASPTRRRPGR